MMKPETSPLPSKAMKALLVAAFFMLLFFLAGTIGLPIPVGLVFVFFVTVAAPGAFALTLLTIGILKLATKGNPTTRWPLFDVGLQVFIMFALMASGIFITRLPSWLQESYPSIREEISRQVSPDHTADEKESFLVSLDRFWEWNTKFLLQEGTPPSEVQQQNVRDTVSKFGEALAPACETCDPQLTLAETRELSRMMNSVTATDVTQPTEKRVGTGEALLAAPALVTTPTPAAFPPAVTDATAPTGVTQAP